MLAIDKVQNATLANGKLSLWVQARTPSNDSPAGMLTDLAAASYEIFNSSYTSVKAKAALNVDASPSDVVPGNRAGLGHYVATWTPGSATVGTYFVRWYYKIESADPESYFDQEIELVALPYRPGAPHYCTVEDLVSQGLPSTVSAAQAQRLIERASRYAEHFTGRGANAFEPQYKAVRCNGNGSRVMQINEPIIGLGRIAVVMDNVSGPSDLTVTASFLKIYNRHLTSRLMSPDDRENPKLEFVHGNDLGGVNFLGNASGYRLTELIWPRGQQNVEIEGLFGFTEPDDSFVGHVPDMLREAVQLLAFRNALPMGSADRQAALRDHRLTLEATRDQSQQFAAPGVGVETGLTAVFTGDPAIDQLLVAFVRPPQFGSA